MTTAVAEHEPVSTIECEACRAVLSLPGAQRAQVCPYCASPNVVAGHFAGETPVFCIPHAEGESLATRSLKAWQSRLGFFRHPGVRKAKLESFQGVYLPAVLYGAVAHTDYSASIAEEYYVMKTRTVMVGGKSQTRTERVKEHEWRPLNGRFSAYATDIIVSASAGLPNEELEAIEPFDMKALRRYSQGLVAGWAVEAPTRALAHCISAARKEFVGHVGGRLAAFMPGDMHSSLRHESQVEQESADPMLVPLWVLALKYDEKKPALRVLINGQTGKTWAQVPWSWQRIIITIVSVVAVLTAIGIFIGVQK
ncbi:MAG: hypothetical protein ACO1OB_10700 [Archangium sp.]